MNRWIKQLSTLTSFVNKFNEWIQPVAYKTMQKLTLKTKRKAMQDTPRAASWAEVSFMCELILRQSCTKVEPLIAPIPRMSFIWEDTMIKATAEVNPELTGPDTKSMRKPALNNGLDWIYDFWVWIKRFIKILTESENAHKQLDNTGQKGQENCVLFRVGQMTDRLISQERYYGSRSKRHVLTRAE